MSSNASVSEYNFIGEPDDDLKCMICLEVARDPLQHEECGKLCCKKCIEKYGRDKPCPNCRQEQSHYYSDKERRVIQALPVKCTNGCEWEGTVGTLEEHVVTCEVALVPCPKQCKGSGEAVQHFLKKDLLNHLKNDCPNRDYECEHCGEKGTYATITQVHDKKCKKKIIPCPNAECGDTMERQQVIKHVIRKCPHTVILCKYQGIGCTTKLKRKDRAAHEEDDKLHLHMAMETINLQSMTVKNNKASESVTFALQEYHKKKEANTEFTPPSSFYTHPNGYRMTVQVFVNGDGDCEGTHVSVLAWWLPGKYDTELKWPFVGTVTFTLLNQLEDKNHHTYTLSLTKNPRLVGDNWGCSTFIPHSKLAEDKVKNTQYLKDDTLYFRVRICENN